MGSACLRDRSDACDFNPVGGSLNPLGDGPCRSLANNGACVPKILPAAELEGVLTGLIVAMPPGSRCGGGR